jgi:Tfp pilus assembly protein FimT
MSKLFVDEIVHQSSQGSGTITIGASGETTNIVGTLQNNGGGVGGDNTPMASGYLNASQTVSNNTFTKVQYNAEYYDTDSAFDTSTYRFTVPSGKGGKYLIHASLYGFGNNNDEREFGLDIYKNGAIAYRQFMGKPGFQATYPSDTTLNATTIVNLSASDYIEFYGMVRVNSGTPGFFGSSTLTNIYSYFNIAKMIE